MKPAHLFGITVLLLALGGAVGLSWHRQHRANTALRDDNAVHTRRLDTLAERLEKQATELRRAAIREEGLRQNLGRVSDQIQRLDEQLATATAAVQLQGKQTAAAEEQLAAFGIRLDTVESYWVGKGELIEPLPRTAFETGYRLPWQGDVALPLQPSGPIIALADGGGVRFSEGSHLRTAGPAAALSQPLSAAGEFSVVVRLKAGNLTQGGPARIVSISRGGYTRNFTIGQERSAYIVRLRTTDNDANGTSPYLSTPDHTVAAVPQTLVYVRQENHSILYLNGMLCAEKEVPGTLANWDYSFPLVLGNEVAASRPWAGEIYEVLFFTRALTEQEVASLGESPAK